MLATLAWNRTAATLRKQVTPLGKSASQLTTNLLKNAR